MDVRGSIVREREILNLWQIYMIFSLLVGVCRGRDCLEDFGMRTQLCLFEFLNQV